MSRHLFGAVAAAGIILASWGAVAVSQPGPCCAPAVIHPARPRGPIFRGGIAPAPGDTVGRYVLQHPRASALFTDTGVRMHLPSRSQTARALSWRVAGGRAVRPQAEKPREAKLHRRVGPRASWEQALLTYGGLRYPGVLPGVDLWFEERAEGVEYGFRAERGEQLRRVRLEYAGVEAVRVVEEGRGLEVDLGEGVLRERGLKCAQEEASGAQREVGCRFAEARRVGQDRWEYTIEVDVEDPARPVVVDPVIVWNNYLGFEEGEEFGDMVRGDAGEIFVTGTFASGSFGEGPAPQGLPGGSSVVVARFHADGGLGEWALFGGEADDTGRAIALGGDKVYVAGVTNSDAFGIPANRGAEKTRDVFVARLDPSSLLLEWIYLVGTGSGDEVVHDLTVGPDGGVFIVGATNSPNFPMERTPSAARGWDVFITRLTPGTAAGPNAASVDWSTVFRGSNLDVAYAVTVDDSDNVYAAGRTESLDLLGSPRVPHSGPDGGADAFIVKLNPEGVGALSTYVGGQGNEEGRALVIQPLTGYLLAGGTTGSVAFPGDPATAASDKSKAFVMALDRGSFVPAGSSVLWNTDGDDEGRVVAAPANSNSVYLGGITRSRNFPLEGAFDTTFGNGEREGFVARLNLGESFPRWSSLVGGSNEDEVLALQVDTEGRVFIGGNTNSSDLAPEYAGGQFESFHPAADGGYDMFVMLADPNEDPPVPGEPDAGQGEPDAGPGEPDAGPGEPDAGTTPDAGPGGPVSPLGWSCSSTNNGGGWRALSLGVLVGLALFVSRRRARS